MDEARLAAGAELGPPGGAAPVSVPATGGSWALLVAALFYAERQQDSINLQVNWWLLLLAAVLVLLMLTTAIGNLFVIVAILIERNLRTIGNYLVLSLAIADLLVALLVMPLAGIYQILDRWTLGMLLCDIWTSADVFCCTASILHLLAIALDRYWAVTRVDYIRCQRNERRILLMILAVWVVASIISIGPLLGWKDAQYERRITHDQECLISQDIGYQIFATCTTFYFPLTLTLVFYWKIYQVARKRIRRKPGQRVNQVSLQHPSSTSSAGAGSRRHHQAAGAKSSSQFGAIVECLPAGETKTSLATPPAPCTCSCHSVGTIQPPIKLQLKLKQPKSAGQTRPDDSPENSKSNERTARDNQNFAAGQSLHKPANLDCSTCRAHKRTAAAGGSCASSEGSSSPLPPASPHQPTSHKQTNYAADCCAYCCCLDSSQQEEAAGSKSRAPEADRTMSASSSSSSSSSSGSSSSSAAASPASSSASSASTRRHQEAKVVAKVKEGGACVSELATPSGGRPTRTTSGVLLDLCWRGLMKRQKVPDGPEEELEVEEATQNTSGNCNLCQCTNGAGQPQTPSLVAQANSPKSTAIAASTASIAAATTTLLVIKPSSNNLPPSVQMSSSAGGPPSAAEGLESKRERKAAKTLAIITGVFVMCWLPFFVMAITMPLLDLRPHKYLFAVLLWLGYVNSMLNPIIYTIFSPDFRKAFKRLLCGLERSRNEQRRKKGDPISVGGPQHSSDGAPGEGSPLISRLRLQLLRIPPIIAHCCLSSLVPAQKSRPTVDLEKQAHNNNNHHRPALGPKQHHQVAAGEQPQQLGTITTAGRPKSVTNNF